MMDDKLRAQAHTINLLGFQTRYLTAGSGPVVLLLHGIGENAADWRWILPKLALTHHVYAPDLPSAGPWRGAQAKYDAQFVARFVAAFLHTLGIERATLVGNSLGGLAAIHLALAAPAQVTALVLMDSAGLGRVISPALIEITVPGIGEATVVWSRTPLGALQRAWGRATLLFAHPTAVPRLWITEQTRLAQQPGFMDAALASLRAQVDLYGQREVVLDQLPHVTMPTLVLWGERDRVVPAAHAHEAAKRLPHAQLAVIPDCGHLPQVERPEQVVTAIRQFLGQADAAHF